MTITVPATAPDSQFAGAVCDAWNAWDASSRTAAEFCPTTVEKILRQTVVRGNEFIIATIEIETSDFEVTQEIWLTGHFDVDINRTTAKLILVVDHFDSDVTVIWRESGPSHVPDVPQSNN